MTATDLTKGEAPQPERPMVLAEQVCKNFGSLKVLRGISLEVKRGEVMCLIGPSGSGKSTFLRCVNHLEVVNAGRLYVDGDLIGYRERGGKLHEMSSKDAAKQRRDIGMVFQHFNLFPHMTVLQNVIEGPIGVKREPRQEVTERAHAILKRVGLAEKVNAYPRQLSGGQQQRVALARALVIRPSILLFDEPLSNLDAKLRAEMRVELRDLQRRLDITSVYVTHDQEEALAVSDRIIVMNNAVIAQDGTPRSLYDAPANAFVADFIGEANLLDCEVEKVEKDIATVRVGPARLTLPARGLPPGKAKLAARPRRLELRAASTPNSLPGTVSKSTYVGSHTEYVIATEAGDAFIISQDVDDMLAPGSKVGIGFPARGPVLIASE